MTAAFGRGSMGRCRWSGKAIAEIAGHSSIRTTAVYVGANPRRLVRILQDVTW
jgi:hypothetical protein